MKRLNVVAAIVVLVAWGVMNEFMHVAWNGVINVTLPQYRTWVETYMIVFRVAVWLLATTMIGAASWIAFNDEIHIGITTLRARRVASHHVPAGRA